MVSPRGLDVVSFIGKKLELDPKFYENLKLVKMGHCYENPPNAERTATTVYGSSPRVIQTRVSLCFFAGEREA